MNTRRCFEILGEKYYAHGPCEGFFYLRTDESGPFANWDRLGINDPVGFLVANGVALGVEGGAFPWCKTAEDAERAGRILERLSMDKEETGDRVYHICGIGVRVERWDCGGCYQTTGSIPWRRLIKRLGLKGSKKFFRSQGGGCSLSESGTWFYGQADCVHRALRVLECISNECYKEESK